MINKYRYARIPGIPAVPMRAVRDLRHLKTVVLFLHLANDRKQCMQALRITMLWAQVCTDVCRHGFLCTNKCQHEGKLNNRVNLYDMNPSASCHNSPNRFESNSSCHLMLHWQQSYQRLTKIISLCTVHSMPRSHTNHFILLCCSNRPDFVEAMFNYYWNLEEGKQNVFLNN